MGTFITGSAALPAAKNDARGLPPGADPANYVQAADWNAHRAALLDLRTHASGWANVLSYGADPTGVANSTAAIQAAINSGRNVLAPAGVYLVDEIIIPVAFKGHRIQGEGYSHWDSTAATTFKARSAGQSSVFKLGASGTDNVTFAGLRIEGDHKAQRGIDARLAGFLTLEEVGIYNATAYGLDSEQGLSRLRRVFFQNDAVGLKLYSDSSVTDSEFTGGTIPVLVVAGGNRFSNVWANSGTVAQVRLAPLNDSTGHANTSFSNLYAGETFAGSTVAPVIDIQGTATQKVQQVQLTGGFIVDAFGATDHKNGLVRADCFADLVIAGVSFRGHETWATASLFTEYAIKTSNGGGLTITGNTFRGINKNALNLSTTQGVVVTGNYFVNCGATIATGDEGANILVNDVNTRGVVTGNYFVTENGSTVPYLVKAPDANLMLVSHNLSSINNATPYHFARGAFTGWQQAVGGVPLMFGLTIDSGTAPPASGWHAAGSLRLNSAPSAGGPSGWQCTAPGDPGTWYAMANLATAPP